MNRQINGRLEAAENCSAPPSIEQAYSWRVALTATLITSLGFGAATSVPILMKPLAQSWNSSAGSLAFVHSSAMVGAAIGGLVLGRLMDRWGFFPIAVLGTVATTSGLLLASVASNFFILLVAYGLLIGAIGQGAFFSPLVAAVSQWFDRRQALAIAIAASGQGVGGLLYPPMLRLGAQLIGWRSTLAVYGIAAGLLLGACAFVFRRAPPRHASPSRAGAEPAAKAHFRPRHFLALCLSLALANLATFMIIGHLTAAGEERGFSPMAAASLLSIMLGMALISRLSSGYLCGIFGDYRVLVVATVVHGIGLGWMAATASYAAIAAGAALIGLGFGAYLPGYAVLVRKIFPPNQSGRRIAEVFFLGFMASGIGSWSGGWLRDMGGNYVAAFCGATLLALIGLLILLGLWRSLDKIKA